MAQRSEMDKIHKFQKNKQKVVKSEKSSIYVNGFWILQKFLLSSVMKHKQRYTDTVMLLNVETPRFSSRGMCLNKKKERMKKKYLKIWKYFFAPAISLFKTKKQVKRSRKVRNFVIIRPGDFFKSSVYANISPQDLNLGDVRPTGSKAKQLASQIVISLPVSLLTM